jgi:HEAT repeat protein
MRRLALAICVLLALPCLGRADSDDDKAVRDAAKTLSKSRDAKDRAGAARSLGGRENPEAVAALAKALSDSDASVREAAASALWKTGKAAAAVKPDLQRTLEDRDPAVAARAAGALSSMGVPDADLAEAWRRVLDNSRDGATAFLAARGLIGLDPPDKLAPPILSYLARNAEDADRGGRRGYDDAKSAEAAGKALERLLKEKKGATVLPLLDTAVKRTPECGKYVFPAVAAVKPLPAGAVDLALAHTGSPVAATRYAAIGLAGKATSDRDAARWVPEATRLLSDSDESVRMEAAWALKGARGLAHTAAPELARLLTEDRSASVRARAAAALEEIGDASNPIPKSAKAAVASAARQPLAAAMKDKDHDVAVAAVAAWNVLYLDTADVLAGLADAAVSGADVPARQKALQCLRNRQGQARPVVETIRPLTRSSDGLIRDDAKVAIEWIERGGAGSPGAIHGGGVAAAAPSRAASGRSKAETLEPSTGAPSSPAAEERGLATLRERHLEFDEAGFSHALYSGDAEAIRAYLDAGMSASHVFAGENRRTPLMILFFSGAACARPEDGHAIVASLLKHGADVNQVDENKNTALMFAAGKCDRQTVRMLLKAGAKLNARNGSGLTALEMGIVTGNSGVEELIAAGARLEPAKAKSWAEAYRKNPKALALVKKASAP